MNTIAEGALSYTFKCTSHRGAFLVLENNATQHSLGPPEPFMEYMLQHHDTWQGHYRRRDLALVRGTIKTSRWTVGAFLGKVDRTHSVTVGAKVPSVAGTELKVTSESIDFQNYEQRSGPVLPALQRSMAVPIPIEDESIASSSREEQSSLNVSSDVDKMNQCIFVSVFKIQRRGLLLKKIVASGSRPPSRHGKDRDDGSMMSTLGGSGGFDGESEADRVVVSLFVLCEDTPPQ